MRAILVPAARLSSSDQHGDPKFERKKDGSAHLRITGNRLPNDPYLKHADAGDALVSCANFLLDEKLYEGQAKKQT
ncbi:hypothetical protein NFJ02_23g53080 [Pycnococcus provasolii]